MAELTIDNRRFPGHDLIQLVLPKLIGDVLFQLFGLSQVRKLGWILEQRGWKIQKQRCWYMAGLVG